MLIRFSYPNLVVGADMVWFDCLMGINIFGSIYFANHYKCSEARLENSVVRDTTFCLAIFFGQFLYKDLFFC